jgi:hypothetical protein
MDRAHRSRRSSRSRHASRSKSSSSRSGRRSRATKRGLTRLVALLKKHAMSMVVGSLVVGSLVVALALGYFMRQSPGDGAPASSEMSG